MIRGAVERWLGRFRARRVATAPPAGLRRLFLDDDPARAAQFLAEDPEAVWVETASDCIARLEERWDEVHLDHDLGGEHFVDHGREDCGMEVVRWLCLVRRPHLRPARFFVHSHNPGAATMMGLELLAAGYQVELRPFGAPPPPPLPEEFDGPSPTLAGRVVGWLRRVGRRGPIPDSSANPPVQEPLPDVAPLDRLDLGWVRPVPTARPRPDRPEDPAPN